MPESQNKETKIAHPKFRVIVSFFLFGIFALLYIGLAPNLLHQPWDSLNYGYSTEVNGIKAIWGNHPLGHVLLSIVFFLSKQLGYAGRALPVFQLTNGIIGALIVALFFSILAFTLEFSTLRALGFAVILGASNGFWFFAGTGDIYILSMMFSLLAWMSLIYEITSKKMLFPRLSGIFTGLAVLSHQLNVMLIPVGVLIILLTPLGKNQTPKIKIVQMTIFVATSALVVVSGYFLIGYVATSSFSPLNIIDWAKGYFGDPSYGRYLSPQYFSTARETATLALLALSENKAASSIRLGVLTIFVLLLPLGLAANRSIDAHKVSVLKAAFLECLIIWPLIFWWEPQNLKFWLLTLIPWVILLALSFEAVFVNIQAKLPKFKIRLQRVADFVPLLMGITMLGINARFGMLNQHDDKSRESVAFNKAMETWISHSNPGDVLITAGDLIPNLLFWENRPNTVNLYRSLQADNSSGDFHDLRTIIDQALCNHHAVLLTPKASEYITDEQLAVANVSREALRLFFKEHTSKEFIAFWYRDLFDKRKVPVYILTRSGTCTN
jgi:hypothetical protein